jgi:hypothetical protein
VIPTPLTLYVHDDLTADVDGEAAGLARELLALIRSHAHVRILTLEEQLAAVSQEQHEPFSTAIGIGAAGERVARQLHARTGWFPSIRRVGLTREENGRGGYSLVSTEGPPLATQLRGVHGAPSLAVVDDTVFSGLTMEAVLRALPPDVRARTHVFCLRGVAATLGELRALCPVTAGLAAPGRLLSEVSFINASGLVRRGAIRRRGQPPLAFFERPEWMRAWFPGRTEAILDLCQRLAALLTPPACSPV